MPRYLGEKEGRQFEFEVDDTGAVVEINPPNLYNELRGGAYLAYVNYRNALRGVFMQVPTSTKIISLLPPKQ